MIDQKVRDKYTVVIGLEMHAQLSTGSKIYAPDLNSFGDEPNTNVSVVSLAHPGTLPKLNKKVLEYAIKMGITLNCEISRYNIFCRKNYFYPDLPKGYQLTQDKTPICLGGTIPIKRPDGAQRQVKLNRIHVEEDAGKSIHLPEEKDTLIDLNRAGVPLIEIVTEPDIRSSEEAALVLTEIRKLVRYLGICDGNMEEGSLRCDANVSIMPKGATEYGRKVEIKNMNSIKFLRMAIDHEVDRQVQLIESGQEVISETRTFDPNKGTSFGMRTKEELNDYRYFPEPDLSPVIVTDDWLSEIKADMPVLPAVLKNKFMEEFGLPEYDADLLTESRAMAEYFEAVSGKTKNYKAVSNWIMGPIKSFLNDKGMTIDDFPIGAGKLAELIDVIDSGKINFTIASQQLFPLMAESPGLGVLDLAQRHNLVLEADEGSLAKAIEEVLSEHPDKVKAYRSGKKNLLGMFMGELMKKTKGKADPKLSNKLLKEKLED